MNFSGDKGGGRGSQGSEDIEPEKVMCHEKTITMLREV